MNEWQVHTPGTEHGSSPGVTKSKQTSWANDLDGLRLVVDAIGRAICWKIKVNTILLISRGAKAVPSLQDLRALSPLKFFITSFLTATGLLFITVECLLKPLLVLVRDEKLPFLCGSAISSASFSGCDEGQMERSVFCLLLNKLVFACFEFGESAALRFL